jgi:hypothetical protein
VGRRRALLLSAAGALLLAACGGSGRLSHGSFVAKANAICADYHAHAAKLPRPHKTSAFATYARRLLPLYRDALARLEALRPPNADASAYAQLLARDRGIERDVEAIARAAHAGNASAYRAALARARTDDARSSELARTLGLDVCARA